MKDGEISTIERMPPELLDKIFSYFSDAELIPIAATCNRFSDFLKVKKVAMNFTKSNLSWDKIIHGLIYFPNLKMFKFYNNGNDKELSSRLGDLKIKNYRRFLYNKKIASLFFLEMG